MGSGIFRSASSTTTVWRSYFRRFDRLSVRSGRTLHFGQRSSVSEPIEVTFGRILPRDFFFQDLSEAVSEPVEVTDDRIAYPKY